MADQINLVEFGDARLPERFWNKIQVNANGCWIWTGSVDSGGYGQFYVGVQGKPVRTHRLMCTLAHGNPTEESYNALHSCDTPRCVNPDHLRWGTLSENTQDMISRGRMVYDGYRCNDGHLLSGENLYINKTSGQRVCKECRKKYDKKRRPKGTKRK